MGAVAFLRPPAPPAATGKLIPEVASQPQFIDAQHGWLYVTRASGLGLYGTVDGGAHWSRVYARQSGAFHFFDRSNGVLLDADGWIELTSDGGRTWHANGLLPAFSNVNVAGLAFFGDSRRGLAVVWRPDNTAAVLLTDDAIHWRSVTRISLAPNFSLAANSQAALLVGYAEAGSVAISGDGGKSWTQLDKPAYWRPLERASVWSDRLVLEGHGDMWISDEQGGQWTGLMPPSPFAGMHDPALFYAADGTPFVLDNYRFGNQPDSRLFVADSRLPGGWRALKLP